jgi:predicted Rossmann fold flavoprotein
MKKQLVVIGGGAAGVFCAVNAAARNPQLQVTVIEKTGKLLSKVKVSGGGRCNVTHHEDDITAMSNRYPRGKHFVRKAFHEFFTTDTVQWFTSRGVPLKTEKDGRMFPVSNQSESIIQCLLREASDHQVEFRLNTNLVGVTVSAGVFELRLERQGKEDQIKADYLCLASGGMLKPEQFGWLFALGHSYVSPLPSLFTFNAPGHPITKLMGVAVQDAEVKLPAIKYRDRGPVLITHWGLSGPAVLKASAWCARDLAAKEYTTSVIINWCPEEHEQSMREKLQLFRHSMAAQLVRSRAPIELPQRLWEQLADEAGIGARRWADLPSQLQNKLAKLITGYELPIKGKTTFKEEFVTAGGVQLSEVDPVTMESRKVPGLYFAGEVLDVDGVTGGFNFQHAWTSGWNAATHIAYKSLH